jgi:hypothetical protein
VAAPLLVGPVGCGTSGSHDSHAGGNGLTAANAALVSQLHGYRPAKARSLFSELCAGCHTLADAGARGRRFNLDHVPGMKGPEVWDAVRSGGPGMPAWGEALSDKEVQELVLYVLDVTRKSRGWDEWQLQIVRRREGETARWVRIARKLERRTTASRRRKEGRRPHRHRPFHVPVHTLAG